MLSKLFHCEEQFKLMTVSHVRKKENVKKAAIGLSSLASAWSTVSCQELT